MLPSLSRVTRFSGTGRSSVVSHQSTECLAASVRVHCGDELGQLGLLAAHGLGVGLADHLDVAHRILVVLGGGVEVVEPQRLLVDRVVALGAEGRDRLGVVEHVVAAHLVRPVRQPVRVLVIGRAEQDLGAVGGAGGDDHDVAGVDLTLAAAGHHHPGHRAAGGIGFQPGHLGPADQRHVRHGRGRAGPRSPRRRTWRAPGTGSRRTRRSGCRCCAAGRPRPARSRTGRGTGGSRPWPGRRRSAGAAAHARPAATGTASTSGPRSGPRRAPRAPGTAARPPSTTARSRHRTAARPGRSRRRA